ncbi:MAG: hypothetical protein ACFWTJ_11860 [Lachnoclostridium sp.]
MSIQIFGKSKCFRVKKAEYCSREKRIKCQLIDLSKYGMSLGEYKSVKAENLLEHPGVFQTLIVRNGRQAMARYQPDVWKDWV